MTRIINSKKFNDLISQAIAIAEDSPMAQKHAALLITTNGKKIIGSAHNNIDRTCIRGSCQSRTGLHAEVGCLLSSKHRKKDFKKGLWATANYKNRNYSSSSSEEESDSNPKGERKVPMGTWDKVPITSSKGRKEFDTQGIKHWVLWG